jgi:hypothetical protein
VVRSSVLIRVSVPRVHMNYTSMFPTILTSPIVWAQLLGLEAVVMPRTQLLLHCTRLPQTYHSSWQPRMWFVARLATDPVHGTTESVRWTKIPGECTCKPLFRSTATPASFTHSGYMPGRWPATWPSAAAPFERLARAAGVVLAGRTGAARQGRQVCSS